MAAHRPAHIARHAAIVLAGATSLSLTVVAGAYIVQQMADTHRAAAELAAPTTPRIHDSATDPGPTVSDAVLTVGSFDHPALFATMPADPRAATTRMPQAHTDSPAAAPAGIGGKLRVGPTYIGAEVAPGRADTLAFTVDTNALTALTDFILSQQVRETLGIHGDAGDVTRLRTEVDTHTGEVTLTFSDPNLGEHGLRVDRYPTPTKHAPVIEESTTADTPAPAATTATTATTDPSRTHTIVV